MFLLKLILLLLPRCDSMNFDLMYKSLGPNLWLVSVVMIPLLLQIYGSHSGDHQKKHTRRLEDAKSNLHGHEPFSKGFS